MRRVRSRPVALPASGSGQRATFDQRVTSGGRAGAIQGSRIRGFPYRSGRHALFSPPLPPCGPLPFGYFYAEGGSLARWGVAWRHIPYSLIYAKRSGIHPLLPGEGNSLVVFSRQSFITERHPRTIKIYALPFSLSRQRERAGVRVVMISGVFPLTFISPQRGEEIERFYFSSNLRGFLPLRGGRHSLFSLPLVEDPAVLMAGAGKTFSFSLPLDGGG
jgi:hypothetical protein